jgi:hypothetical protein
MGVEEVVVKVILITVELVVQNVGGNRPGGGRMVGRSGVGVGEVSGERLKAAAKFCKCAKLQSSSCVEVGVVTGGGVALGSAVVGSRMVPLRSTGDGS